MTLAMVMMMKMILVKSKMLQSMKKIFSSVMLVAAAAMAFIGCQKPEMIKPVTSQEVMLTFTSEKPAFDDETKTEWTGSTIQWSKGDKISVAYTVNGAWQNANGNASGDAKLYKSDELSAASATAQFNVSTYFKGTTEGTHVFYGVYPAPSETGFASAPVATVTVASNQNPKANSYDSGADLMIGVSDEYASRPGESEKISLKWERLVAHAVISLTNINGITAGEKVENITFTAQDAANLVGQQKVNLITKEVVKDNNAANVLKVGASNLAVADGSVSFWTCFLPETITSLNVVVETDKATYTRNIASCNLEFKKNARNTLSIKMNEAVREEKAVATDEVVDVLNRALTGITGTTYTSWSGKTSVSSAVYAGQSAGGNESIQLRSNNSNSGIITTASGGFVKSVSVIWNSNTSSGRTLNVYGSKSAYSAPTDLYNDTKSGTLLGTIVCGTSTELVVNGEYEFIGLRSVSGAMYVSEIKVTWSNGSSDTPEVPDTTPSVELEFDELELSANEAEGEIEVVAKNIASIEVRALTEEGSQDESDWLVAEFDEENSCVTYSAEANETEDERTAFIEVYCLDAEGNDIVAGVNVTQAGKVDVNELPVGIASIYDAIKSEVNTALDEFTVSLTNAVVTYVNGNSAFVEDATAGILIYKSGNGLAAGDKLNGVLSGKGYVRYGVCQITEFDMTNVTKETGAAIPCAEITVADLLSDYNTYLSRRVKIVGATVTDGATGVSDKNGAVNQNGSSINLYNNNSSVNFVETEVVDFYAYPSYYSSTKQLATWETPVTKKVATPVITCTNNLVTVTCGTPGASVFCSIDGGEYEAYSAAIEIDETVTVKAYAIKSGLTDSEVATQECEFVDLGSQPQTIDATLSFASTAQRTSQTTSQQTWEQNGIKLVNDKGSSSSNVADYSNPARFYKDSKLTISAPGNITKIVFVCNSSSYATALKSSITTGGTVTASGSNVTVVLSTPATSFVISKLSGGQVRMNSLTVTYEN